MELPDRFANLLREGTEAIQRNESIERKKPLKMIYEELGTRIGKKVSTIEYYLKGHVPGTVKQLEQLGEEILRRGGLEKGWLEEFLITGGHPNPSSVLAELVNQSEAQPTNPQPFHYKRTKMVVVRKLHPNRYFYSETNIEIEVVGNSDLEYVRHLSWAIDMPMYEKIKLEFQSLSRDGQGTMRDRVLKDVPGIFSWRVDFLPPLKQGQKASYIYKQHIDNWYPWTYEDCEKFYETGEMMTKYATARYKIPVSVDHFQLRMEFPAYYPISLPTTGGFGVYFSLGEDFNEKTRIIAEKGFSVNCNHALQKWTMELNVKNALAGFSYELQWFPPRKNQLP